MKTTDQLKEKGWHLTSEVLPLIVKGTVKANYNIGKGFSNCLETA